MDAGSLNIPPGEQKGEGGLNRAWCSQKPAYQQDQGSETWVKKEKEKPTLLKISVHQKEKLAAIAHTIQSPISLECVSLPTRLDSQILV